MKRYIIIVPDRHSDTANASMYAVVESFIRGFEIAIKAASEYRWNLLISAPQSASNILFETNCDRAADALASELSNIGVTVKEVKEILL